MSPPVTRIPSNESLPKSADVVIIGGGIAGIAAAYHLAKKRLTVAVVEKGVIAGEQSSRNWGWCRQQNRDLRELALAQHALEIWGGLNAELGDPTDATSYALCIYAGTTASLVAAADIPPHPTKWQPVGDLGYQYKDKALSPDGISNIKLGEGLVDGATKISVKGSGAEIDIPGPDTLGGVVSVQLHEETGTACWGATFTEPFSKQDTSQLKAKSD